MTSEKCFRGAGDRGLVSGEMREREREIWRNGKKNLGKCDESASRKRKR